VQKAFDEQGNPTRAAEGFARSHGVSVSSLRPVSTQRGEVLGFKRMLDTRRTAELMAERVPALIGGLRFPKTMKWESSGARFARPVRWIVCLYGGKVVPFVFAGVPSGRVTFRRPWYGERAGVRNAGDYLSVLERIGVVVDDDARKRRIADLARSAAARAGLTPADDPGLLEELTFMLEDPRVFVGSFEPCYLSLPAEVVTTAMRSHQRYIALVDGAGELVPKFVAFTDGPVRRTALVRTGNEKVLRARLEDAQFYWREDLKRGVDGLARELRRIVFIEGLGTVGQKSDRIGALAREVNDQRDESQRRPVESIDRAAAIAKADLASEMIKDGKEFTLLQGRIGSYYAMEGGEDPNVSEAVDQHYWPRTPADPVPDSPLAVAIGVADRVDTVCGCFLAGLVPSGSQDPYGLRRQANGLLRIIERAPEIRLDRLIASSLRLYVGDGLATEQAAGETAGRVGAFFEARCEAFLKDRGMEYDVVAAVSRVSWPRPGVALIRAREISEMRGDARFERLITGVKRVGNILADDKRTYGSSWAEIHSALDPASPADNAGKFSVSAFQEPAETVLYESVTEAVPRMEGFDRRHDFRSVLDILSGLADPIDRYFDDVLVNCEDPKLRENRHRFLAAVFLIFSKYADFSYIVETGES
jgi:glycyl-tRNA synthetase beta chain